MCIEFVMLRLFFMASKADVFNMDFLCFCEITLTLFDLILLRLLWNSVWRVFIVIFKFYANFIHLVELLFLAVGGIHFFFY